jgi:hypothetical protein
VRYTVVAVGLQVLVERGIHGDAVLEEGVRIEDRLAELARIRGGAGPAATAGPPLAAAAAPLGSEPPQAASNSVPVSAHSGSKVVVVVSRSSSSAPARAGTCGDPSRAPKREE